jgi:hypothetical protein
MEGQYTHPIIFIEQYFKQIPWVSYLELGIYTYVPQTNTDPNRIIIKTPPEKLSDTYHKMQQTLRNDEDIAFQSRIHTQRGVFQTLLVDFATSKLKYAQETAMQITSFSKTPYALLVFSGRSFHLYAFSFYMKTQWIQHMGQCLLLNKKNEEKIVDDRWIGYRLIQGYGSLRLTCNNKNYLTEPYVINIFK